MNRRRGRAISKAAKRRHARRPRLVIVENVELRRDGLDQLRDALNRGYVTSLPPGARIVDFPREIHDPVASAKAGYGCGTIEYTADHLRLMRDIARAR